MRNSINCGEPHPEPHPETVYIQIFVNQSIIVCILTTSCMPKSALDIIKDTNQGKHSPAQHLIAHCIRLLPPITQASSRHSLNALHVPDTEI